MCYFTYLCVFDTTKFMKTKTKKKSYKSIFLLYTLKITI
jgi:hypothetical protein